MWFQLGTVTRRDATTKQQPRVEEGMETVLLPWVDQGPFCVRRMWKPTACRHAHRYQKWTYVLRMNPLSWWNKAEVFVHVCGLISIILTTFLCCASTLVCTVGAGHTNKIPDILQLLLKVCIHAGIVTASGPTTLKQHTAVGWSSCGTVGSAVRPLCTSLMQRDHSRGESDLKPVL